MKTISILLISCLTALSAFTQNIVTITVRGTNVSKVGIDGRYYNVNKEINNEGNNMAIIITDLQPGQHTLKLLGNDAIENANDNNTTFNLRSGYNLHIAFSSNGSVQLKETLARDDNDSRHNTPMPDARFNILYKNIKVQKMSSVRMRLVSDAFTNSDNNFSTAQAKKMILLVSSQSSRLELAKASYPTITDTENFPRLYDLLYSKSQRNELSSYVDNYNAMNHGDTGNIAMDDTNFKALYLDAQQQWPANEKYPYLINAFGDESNYFTVSQAKQLIELLNNESERLQLAKASYHGITDPANFNQLYNLLNNQASRNELASFVASYNANNGGTTAMSTATFNNIYLEAQRQISTNAKISYLNNAFTNTNNFFTVFQVKQLLQLLTDESSQLYLAKASYRGIVDRNNFTQIQELFRNQSYRSELIAYVNNYNNGNSIYTITAMSATAFDALYRDVRSRFGFGAKMSALIDVFNTASNYFAVSQVKQLIQLVSDEANRLQLAKSSYNNIADPANFSQLYDLFGSQANRNELEAFVKNQNGNPVYNTKAPMSDAAFNVLYRDVQNRFGFGAKMAAVTDIFANTSNYFTVIQAKELIKFVDDESNRLQLAKSSYRNITDTENFRLMYEVLASQSSRDELAIYVNSYSYNK